MNRSYFNWIMLLAAISVLLVVAFMWKDSVTHTIQPTKQITPRPVSPFKSYIAAVGIVEPCGGNIFIGSPVNRVVDKVEVTVGQKVKAGDILFRLESRDLQADLNSRCLGYENAVANLQKLQSLPRAEDIAYIEAVLKSAEVELNSAKSQYDRVAGLPKGAMSQEEVQRRKSAYEEAESKLKQTQANFEKTKAGTWKPDIDIAKLQVEEAKASVERIETDIQRTIIRAPSESTVLQIKIHEGEFPPTDSSRTPPMILGNIDKLCLRVNINQFDASFYETKSTTVAFLQGNATIEFPLEFMHLEPFFVTKQNITNDISEKVDTRVLQAIYGFKEREDKVFVGQQMDVFIETHYTTDP